MNNDILHIIIPFFSFNNTKIRKKNLETTLTDLRNFENIHITIVNGSYQDQSLENEDFIKDKKISYIKYNLPSVLWVKENLINLAIESLPQNWEYVCWIDSDVIFLNRNWVNETIQNLKEYDVVQLYKTVIFLDKNGDIDLCKLTNTKPIEASFIYKYITKFKEDFRSTGFGWGLNKKLYDKIGKLFEFAVVGGGDFVFAMCVTQNYEFGKVHSFLTKISSQNYYKKLLLYYDLFKNCSYHYINGLICHQWHGDLIKRQYEDRYNILLNNKFDPDIHVSKTFEDVIYLNDNSKKLEKELIAYFRERND